MTIIIQSHGGSEQAKVEARISFSRAAPPAGGDVSVDEQADFGFLFPPSASADDYLPETPGTVDELDQLGNLMIDAPLGNPGDDPGALNSTLPPIFTYWGQFLDHELTARTDRESEVTNIEAADPPSDPQNVETNLKNARTSRFDLDSVYGGVPVGPGLSADVATVVNGMRHPGSPAKMRVGTARTDPELPDNLDRHRDLPRFVQVSQAVRDAMIRIFESGETDPAKRQKFRNGLPKRAIIGDSRNDENLIVAQFHVSFLRFHNKAVDFLDGGNTGWIADFHSAQMLTRLHYQWLIVEGYLKTVCDAAVVQRVIDDRASHFFRFRAEFDERQTSKRLGNAMPLEFSAAGFRFGHSMVRAFYDYNKNFGRPGLVIPNASFELIFTFTGGGPDGPPGINAGTENRLPQNWVIDWTRLTGVEPTTFPDGEPSRLARKIDTNLAPPLSTMIKEGTEFPDGDPLKVLFKHLARRNLRRGYNLKLPTGQALHAYLKAHGAVTSDPIADVSAGLSARPALQQFLSQSVSQFHQRTPLWFYCLAEAEMAGGDRLGEVGSWLVASTFIGVLLSDPDSALSRGFDPSQSPLRMKDGSAIDSIKKWLQFAVVMP